MTEEPRVSVVVLTHNRLSELDAALRRLSALPEQPPLIVVDNASTDGTAEQVTRAFPHVQVVRSARNLGAAGRNLGVRQVHTPHVAFCDDDTWWEPGALRRATELLDSHPRLAAVGARVLVGPERRTDPTCLRMADSPLDSAGLPGVRLIAFMAGAVVMRCKAYREVGGYEPRLFLGAEEALFALDLAARGWHMVYSDEVVTNHHASPARDAGGRRLALLRNRLWIAWLRLPLRDARRESARILREAAAHGLLGPCLRQALAGSGWVLSRRRVLPLQVQQMWRTVFDPPAHPAVQATAGGQRLGGHR